MKAVARMFGMEPKTPTINIDAGAAKSLQELVATRAALAANQKALTEQQTAFAQSQKETLDANLLATEVQRQQNMAFQQRLLQSKGELAPTISTGSGPDDSTSTRRRRGITSLRIGAQAGGGGTGLNLPIG